MKLFDVEMLKLIKTLTATLPKYFVKFNPLLKHCQKYQKSKQHFLEELLSINGLIALIHLCLWWPKQPGNFNASFNVSECQ